MVLTDNEKRKRKKQHFANKSGKKKPANSDTRPCHDRLNDANEQVNDDHAANQANNNTRQLKKRAPTRWPPPVNAKRRIERAGAGRYERTRVISEGGRFGSAESTHLPRMQAAASREP